MGLAEQPEKTASINSSSKTDSSATIANIAIECVMNGNVGRFVQCFDDESDPFHDSVTSHVNARSEDDNKSALDWAALIGNVAMLSELIKRGADINAASEKGKLRVSVLTVFSEGERIYVYVVVRPSVVCLSVICNIRAPYSGD